MSEPNRAHLRLRSFVRETAVLALPALVVLAHSAMFRPYLIDDAYITFTAAKNLAAGYGPVFMQGEQVEATSSMLWAVALAPFEMLGVGARLGSKILGALSALGVVVVALRSFSSMHASASQVQRIAVGLLIATSSNFVLWSSYGMEGGLVSLLLVWSLHTFSRELATTKGWKSAVPIFLLETVRPEGFMFIVLFIGLRVAYAVAAPRGGRPVIGRWIAALLVPLLAYELWGWLYFGALLPNPVAAKLGSEPLERIRAGFAYLADSSIRPDVALVVLSFACAPLALFARTARWSPRGLLADCARDPWYLGALALVSLQLSFTVATGGDWMPGGRFVAPVVPLAALALVVGFAKLAADADAIASTLPGVRRMLHVSACLVWLLLTSRELQATRRLIDGPVGKLQAACDHALGATLAYLNRRAQAEDVVACSDIGYIGYHFRGRVHDWWGLADAEIAASGQSLGRIDPETVLKHHPRFIVLYSNEPVLTHAAARDGLARTSRVFLDSSAFVQRYRQRHSVAFSPVHHFVTFERVD